MAQWEKREENKWGHRQWTIGDEPEKEWRKYRQNSGCKWIHYDTLFEYEQMSPSSTCFKQPFLTRTKQAALWESCSLTFLVNLQNWQVNASTTDPQTTVCAAICLSSVGQQHSFTGWRSGAVVSTVASGFGPAGPPGPFWVEVSCSRACMGFLQILWLPHVFGLWEDMPVRWQL